VLTKNVIIPKIYNTFNLSTFFKDFLNAILFYLILNSFIILHNFLIFLLNLMFYKIHIFIKIYKEYITLSNLSVL